MPTFNGTAELDGHGVISEIQGAYAAATLAGVGIIPRIFFDTPTLAGQGFLPRVFLTNPANLSGLGAVLNPIVPVLIGTGSTGSGTSFTLNTTAAIPAGAVAFAWFRGQTSNRPLSSVSDGTNTYTIINSTNADTPQGAYFYYPSGLASGTTITFTTSGAATSLFGGICYIPNVTATPFDQFAANNNSPPVSTETANLTQSHEMAICVFTLQGNATLINAPVGLAPLVSQRTVTPSIHVSAGEVFTNVAAPYATITTGSGTFGQTVYTFEFLPWVGQGECDGTGAVACPAAQIFTDSSEIVAGAGAVICSAVQIFHDLAETISGTGAIICSPSQKWTTNPATISGLGAVSSDSVHTPQGAVTAAGTGAVICAPSQIWTTNPAVLGGVGATICNAAHTPIDTGELVNGVGAITLDAKHTPTDTNDLLAGTGTIICNALKSGGSSATLAGSGAVIADSFPAAIDTGETIPGAGALICDSVHTVFDQLEVLHGSGAVSAPGVKIQVDAGPEELDGVGTIFAESEFQVILTDEELDGIGSCTATTIQTFTDSGEVIAGSGAIVCNMVQTFTDSSEVLSGKGVILLDATHPVPASCLLQAFSFISNPIVPVGIGIGNTTNGTNFSITTQVPVPAGATLVVFSTNSQGARAMVSVSDGTNVYAVLVSSNIANIANIGSTGPLQTALPAGSIITVSLGGSAGATFGGALYLVGSWVHEQLATNIVDVAVKNNGSGTTSTPISSGPLTQPYEIVLYIVGRSGNFTSFQGPAGFARLAADAHDVNPSSEIWYTNTVNNGGVSAQSSWATSSSWGQSLITFIEMFATVSGSGTTAASAIQIAADSSETLSGAGLVFTDSVHTVIDPSEELDGFGAVIVDTVHASVDTAEVLPGVGTAGSDTLMIWAASAELDGSGVIIANGSRTPAQSVAAIGGTGAVIATPSVIAITAAALAGGSTAAAIAANYDIGIALLAGGGAMASAASHTSIDAGETLSGSGGLFAGTHFTNLAQATVQSSGAVLADATHIVGSDRPIYAGDGEIIADSVHTVVDPAELLVGNGAVIASGVVYLSGIGSLTGAGAISCRGVLVASATTSAAGIGAIGIDARHTVIDASESYAGAGQVIANAATPQSDVDVDMDGVGTCTVGSTTQLLSGYSPMIQVRTIPLRRGRRRFG